MFVYLVQVLLLRDQIIRNSTMTMGQKHLFQMVTQYKLKMLILHTQVMVGELLGLRTIRIATCLRLRSPPVKRQHTKSLQAPPMMTVAECQISITSMLQQVYMTIF